MAKELICSIDGCLKEVSKKTYCNAHYLRLYRTGTLVLRPRPRADSTIFLETVVIPHDGPDCLIWPFYRTKDGRASRKLRDGNSTLVHRVVCEKVNGPPPSPKHEAAHSCGNGVGGCVNPKHLRWATHKENEADKILHGTAAKGERHGFAILDWDKVNEIRKLRGAESQRSLARRFGVGQQCISSVQRHIIWKEFVS